MQISKIKDDDEFLRHVFSPKEVAPGGLGVLNLRNTFTFPGDAERKESLDCKRLVENYPIAVHNRGAENARRSTERKGTQITYEGFFGLQAEIIYSLTVDDHYFAVEHAPEQGNIAHCDIILKSHSRCTTAKMQTLKAKLHDIVATAPLNRQGN